MPNIYKYELWNGKEVVGYHVKYSPLVGNCLFTFYEESILKGNYNRKPKSFTIPITYRIISDDGIDVHYRIVLDVRRKSKRQIDLVKID